MWVFTDLSVRFDLVYCKIVWIYVEQVHIVHRGMEKVRITVINCSLCISWKGTCIYGSDFLLVASEQTYFIDCWWTLISQLLIVDWWVCQTESSAEPVWTRLNQCTVHDGILYVYWEKLSGTTLCQPVKSNILNDRKNITDYYGHLSFEMWGSFLKYLWAKQSCIYIIFSCKKNCITFVNKKVCI